MVSQILKQKGMTSLFTSAQIPGEIWISRWCARPAGPPGRLRPAFAKALAGAWYEMMAAMSAKGPTGDKVLTEIGEGSQDSLASYKEQLSTTKMFYTPRSAVDFSSSPDLKAKMALVRQFVFDHGFLGANTKSVDDVAIGYPDGSIQGKAGRVRLRFDVSYMKMAAQGKL